MKTPRRTEDDDGPEIDLTIPPERVCFLIVKAREFDKLISYDLWKDRAKRKDKRGFYHKEKRPVDGTPPPVTTA